MYANIALGILSSLPTAIEGTNRLIVDIAMFFGLLVIVAMALNFQYGNAGIPNMGCAVQVIIGAFSVSAIVMRVMFTVIAASGVPLDNWNDPFKWIYSNPANVGLANTFLTHNAVIAIGFFLLSLGTAVVLGAGIGYLLALPAIRLRATYLMIVLITISDASQIIGRNVTWISGGTLGVWIPNVFAWYPGDVGVIMAVVTLLLGLVSFFIFRTMLNSPYGRLMRAMRENEVTLGSIGKNVVGIRRNILMFASGITAIAGVMNVYYLQFSNESGYQRAYWTYWPWLMLILGGPGNNAGTFLGAAVIIALRRLIIVFKFEIQRFFFFPISYLEDIILGGLLVVVMIFRPNGLIPEKLLYIPGVNYTKMIHEDVKVDWRAAPKAREKKAAKKEEKK
ncbi:MAG: branched-chain amino acid ABC transporter permease [Candidatus Bathyarchaeota archaeon]|nr:branched-chain amino acid ABC transporter permease [Candidatus Bathyarchaeota archaeon]